MNATVCRPPQPKHLLLVSMLWGASTLMAAPSGAQMLPPPEDSPEEVMSTRIITEAASPLDGQPLSAAEYALLQEELRPDVEQVPARLSPDLHLQISLLRIRRVLKGILPLPFF